MRSVFRDFLLLALLALAAGCNRENPAANSTLAGLGADPVTADRLANADSDPGNWLIHGRTYFETRYSPLTAIHAGNVQRLRLQWHESWVDDLGRQTSSPLVVDGTIYVTTTWDKVFALDSATGKTRWQYDPDVPRSWAANLCCGPVNRGVAFWDNTVYVGTLDGRLIALDAQTGKLKWQTTVSDRSERASITGAPRVIKGKVFIGSGGGDFGVRGRLTAVDAQSGAILWRFFTVPGNPAFAQENIHLPDALNSWHGDWWKAGGGGAVWDAMSYDPQLDLLYIGTGNGTPWPRTLRSPKGGDNLFVSSIIAMKPDTGIVVWHYQTTPGDEWGYDSASQMVLTDLNIAGRNRQVLIQAAANGFVYVLDRSTGSLISANSFVPVTWAEGINLESGRPIENPKARYSELGKSFLASPGLRGAHSWQSMAYNPDAKLLFIPAMVNASELSAASDTKPSRYASNNGVIAVLPPDSPADKTRLIAWDPLAGRTVWSVDKPAAKPAGILATAGSLIFQGDIGGMLQASDAKSGKLLWQFDTKGRLEAAPITYERGGKQYVAVVVGGRGQYSGGSARLLVFALDGADALPAAATQAVVAPPASFGSKAQLVQGSARYARYCSRCHGSPSDEQQWFQELLASTQLADAQQWQLTVYAGQREPKGMPGFFAELSQADAEAIRAYVVDQAQR